MINIDLDHIVELQDGGAKLDRANVLQRCRSCHVRKTALAKSQRAEREYWERRIRNKGGGLPTNDQAFLAGRYPR
jgi:5-methylcytosine-specific restriction endonuclease McrA